MSRYVLLLFAAAAFGQTQGFKIPDSLKNASFLDLYIKANKTSKTDTLTTVLYYNTYLQKAKNTKDSVAIAEGYAFLSHFETLEERKLAMLDSSIYVSKDLKCAYYPLLAYSFKGVFHKRRNRFGLALNNHLKVLELAKAYNLEEYVHVSTHNIATIKQDIGRDAEALQLYKLYLKYEINKKERDTFNYLEALRGISESYSRNNILDSAKIYNTEGLKITETVIKEQHSTFLINKGINLYHEQKYKLAQDVLEEGIRSIDNHLRNKRYVIKGYFYLGQVAIVFNDVNKAEQHFLSVDSIIKKDAIVLPELRKSYEFLMTHYKSNAKNKDYLKTIDRLLKFDSILYNDRGLISDRLIREFDTPMILLEKENAIAVLREDKKSLGNVLVVSIVISILALTMFYFQFRKRRLYKKRFETLMNSKNAVNDTSKQLDGTEQELDISESIVTSVLEALDSFEKNKTFLNKNITTSSLSKKMETNSKYLSKIVNHYKKKTFTQYINDLRINYAVESLKADERLRRYTIQGIADEMGFNTAESFSSAFKKSTGLKPSYFVKKINEAA